jgi:hypothetical protein
MTPPAPPEDLARVDAYLRAEHGKLGDLGTTGRNFARAVNRLQRLARMVLVSEDKSFKRTVQRWRLVGSGKELELGTERRGAGQFALIARWAGEEGAPEQG